MYVTEPLVTPDPFDPGNFPAAFPIACGGPTINGVTGQVVYGDESGLNINDSATGTAANANKPEFKANTLVRIFNSGGSLIEDNEVHTSCSKDLAVGDIFGSLEVIDLTLVPK